MHQMTAVAEFLPCAACSQPAAASALRHKAIHNQTAYTLYRCPKCDLEFWSPLKADPSVYEDEGFEAYTDYHDGTRPFPRWAAPLFEGLERGEGRALDIGCGDGAVMHRLASLGFDVHGIDLDNKSVRVAREKFGLDQVQAITLDDYAAACGRQGLHFDFISFFEVLEHQDDPLGFLRKVSTLGKPRGRVAGSVPNRQRFLAAIDRKLSDGDLPPHHFLWFSSRALAHLLDASGFADIRVSRVGTLTYRQFATKLAGAIRRKAARWPRLLAQIIAPALVLLSPAAALVPWLGMRFAPSHLFFTCEIPDPVGNEVRK
jgi:2-polyprenyl-3-methyl-5-hydroxy-6-metoxy-1,4-benzoquinol methylase